MHDNRLTFENEDEIQALWGLIQGNITPDQFQSKYPTVYNQVQSKVGSLSGGGGSTR